MRLGAYDCQLKKGSKAAKAYGTEKISERHRHRYEVNTEFHEQLTDAGLVFSGMNGKLVEVVELPQLDWFVACQFHPEFKSRPDKPHPLFKGLIDAAVKEVAK
jgi:CTP synthase